MERRKEGKEVGCGEGRNKRRKEIHKYFGRSAYYITCQKMRLLDASSTDIMKVNPRPWTSIHGHNKH